MLILQQLVAESPDCNLANAWYILQSAVRYLWLILPAISFAHHILFQSFLPSRVLVHMISDTFLSLRGAFSFREAFSFRGAFFFRRCEEHSDEAISVDLAGNKIAMPRQARAYSLIWVVANFYRLEESFPLEELFPFVVARSIATKQSRWT